MAFTRRQSASRPPDGSNDDRTKVFISYSRSDTAFAERLAAALGAHGIRVLIDHRDLPDLEAWKKELLELMRQSHAVAFIVSSSFVASKWCEWEVGHSVELGKRLAPLVIDRAATEQIPAPLKEIQYLFLDDHAKFDEQVGRLAAALEENRDWTRAHTRIGEDAGLWVADGRPNDSHLLSGSELAKAESWMNSRPRRGPRVTELQQEFIRASRTEERARIEQTRRSQRRLGAALVGLAALGLSGTWAGLALMRANLEYEARNFAGQAWLALERDECDSALRFGVLGLPAWRSVFSTKPSPEAEAAVASAAWSCRLVKQLEADVAEITTIAPNTDHGRLASGYVGGDVKLWDLKSRSPVLQFRPHTGPVTTATPLDGGRRLFTTSKDRFARLWDLRSGNAVPVGSPMRHHGEIHGADISGDQRHAATFGEEDIVRLWRLDTGDFLSELPGHGASVHGARFSPRGDRIVTGTGKDEVANKNGGLHMWDTSSSVRTWHVADAHDSVNALAYDPYGNWIASGGEDGLVRVWDAATGAERPGDRMRHRGRITILEFHPYLADLLLATSEDGGVAVWNTATGKAHLRLSGHREAVTIARFNRRGDQILSGGNDGIARLWSLDDGRELLRFGGHDRGIADLHFGVDDTEIVTASRAGHLRVWSTHTDRYRRPVGVHPDALISGVLSPDGKLAATVQHDAERLAVWNVADGTLVEAFEPRNGGPPAFSPDGARLAIPTKDGEDNVVLVFDTKMWKSVARIPATGKAHPTLINGASLIKEGEPTHVNGVTYDADGRRLMTWGNDATAVIWDAVNGQRLLVLHDATMHNGPIQFAAFSRDGQLAITTGNNGEIGIWDAKTGRFRRKLAGGDGQSGHHGLVYAANFSPDGQRIVSSGDDETVRLWSIDGKELHVFSGHLKIVTTAQFNSTGTRLLTSGHDGTARIWDVEARHEILRLDGQIGEVTTATFGPGDAHVLMAGQRGALFWDVGWAAISDPVELRAKACAEKLESAPAFSKEQMRDPILSGRAALHDPCRLDRQSPAVYFLGSIAHLLFGR